jgi:hypothetical protein
MTMQIEVRTIPPCRYVGVPFRAITVLALLVGCARPGAPPPAAHEERPSGGGSSIGLGDAHAALHEVRAAGEAPSIELGDALAAARAYAARNQVDLTRHYVQSAVFDFVAREWRFTWQTPMVKGGTTFITVAESGEIRVIHGR